MDPTTTQLVTALHRASSPYVLALTGGGTTAAAQLLAVPGGSRTVLEVTVPYHERAFADYLGRAPEHYCSAAASEELARRAYARATWLLPRTSVVGLGCTASLATDRPKKGDHRFHLATHTAGRVATYSLTLSKGARDRAGEEAVLDAVLLNALAEPAGIPERLPVPLFAGEQLQVTHRPHGDLLSALLRGEVSAFCVETDGRWRADAPTPCLLLPGSFNPVHHGHWGLADLAARRYNGTVAFELSVTNVDKPPLPAEEVRYRLAQFAWRAPVWVTRAPTFAEKAPLFPGVVFLIGYDTVTRLVDPRYYGDRPAHRNAALATLRHQGCRFLVAGREDSSGCFHELREAGLPGEFADLFEGLCEREFHAAVSSTRLRQEPDPTRPPPGPG